MVGLVSGLLAVPATSVAQTADVLRAPSVPLVAVDPCFSIWSPADGLTDAATVHWTGKAQPLSPFIRVDGEAFRLMGVSPSDTAAMPQVSAAVHATRTVYTFASSRARVTLTFLAPSLPCDLDPVSRPVTYMVSRTYWVNSGKR